MKKGLIWGGFGALLLVGIVSGYAPDLMLASALRGARSEGLLSLPTAAKVPAADDARLGYEAAVRKYPQGVTLLTNDFVRQVKRPAPHVIKYLAAMVEASARPGFSPIPEERDYRTTVPTELQPAALNYVAKALSTRADNEASLLPAARIASHLKAQGDILSTAYWSTLVPRIMDRAVTVGLSPDARRNLVTALGEAPSAREALRRQVVQRIVTLEKGREERASVSQTRQELAYLQFWRNFFTKVPTESTGFIEAVRKADGDITAAENRAGNWSDFGTVGGTSSTPWTYWATAIEKARVRLASAK